MPLAKLVLVPNRAGYTHEDGEENVEVKLDGGLSHKRTDILNAASLVAVQWVVGDLAFEYLRAFYNTTLVRGAESFLIDLAIDKPELTEHTVQFVGSLKHTVKPFTVTALLEVIRNEVDAEYDANLVALVNAFGADEAAIDAGLATLAQLVNVDLPGAVPA